ncbi:unnamed protein product [Owenia fusiformis]|uniref:Uncharacterized protein n=1 Tax=Owenia fusiformis TaxID=6347 RepID=A0A8J1UXX2_OWEFU|nr:unnamed protein product [Owenia fusiformis]
MKKDVSTQELGKANEDGDSADQTDSNITNISKSFAESTTLHGVSKVFGSRSNVRKCIWGLIFIGSVIGFIAQSVTLFVRYLDYPNDVSVGIINPNYLEFPAVTICNHNAMKLSKLKDTRFQEFVDLQSQFNSKKVKPSTQTPVSTPSPDWTDSLTTSAADGFTSATSKFDKFIRILSDIRPR